MFAVYYTDGTSSTIEVSREPEEHRHATSRMWRAIREAETKSFKTVARIATTYMVNGVPVDMESWSRNEIRFYMRQSDSDFKG